MNTLSNTVRRTLGKPTLLRDERGLSTVEYVIILVLIAAAAIGSWIALGTKIKEKLADSNKEMDKVQIETPKEK